MLGAQKQHEDARCLILAHGAGSSADFLARAFPPQRCRTDTVLLEDRTGSCAVVAARLRAAVDRLRPRYREVLVGGVSIGSHAAARVAAGVRVDGCVLALPAWAGPPGIDNPTALAADEVARTGAAAVLRRLDSDPRLGGDWVTAELRRAWADRPTLAAELLLAAREPGPDEHDLRAIAAPVLVLALAEDPFHPVDVARRWTALIPQAELVVLDREAPAAGREVFGAAVGRWLNSFDG